MAIVSFKHNFIFVKTTKTAGSSIELDLSRRVEDGAIVTPVFPTPVDHHPRNYETPDGTFYNHMSARKIRDLIGADRFARMFKFCVEREPVAKCISHFHMLRNSPLHNEGGRYTADWDAYCRSGRFPVDLEKYSELEDGVRHLIVDRVLCFETIKQDLPLVLQACGIADFKLEATEKSDYARNRLIRPDEVTETQRNLISHAFAETRRLTGLYP